METPSEKKFFLVKELADGLNKSFPNLLKNIFDLQLYLYAQLKVTKTARPVVPPEPLEPVDPDPTLEENFVPMNITIPEGMRIARDIPLDLRLRRNGTSYTPEYIAATDWDYVLLSREFSHFISVNHDFLKKMSDGCPIAYEANDYRVGNILAVIPDQGLEISEENPLPKELFRSPEFLLYVDKEAKEKLEAVFRISNPNNEKPEGKTDGLTKKEVVQRKQLVDGLEKYEWKDIVIMLHSNDTATIRNKDSSIKKHAHLRDFGLMDRRNKAFRTPNRLYQLLKVFANTRKINKSQMFKAGVDKHRISSLNSLLKQLTGNHQIPISYDKDNDEYFMRCTVRDETNDKFREQHRNKDGSLDERANEIEYLSSQQDEDAREDEERASTSYHDYPEGWEEN